MKPSGDNLIDFENSDPIPDHPAPPPNHGILLFCYRACYRFFYKHFSWRNMSAPLVTCMFVTEVYFIGHPSIEQTIKLSILINRIRESVNYQQYLGCIRHETNGSGPFSSNIDPNATIWNAISNTDNWTPPTGIII